ncbi:hypothetical protein D3C72_1708730 [compost metagenome]
MIFLAMDQANRSYQPRRSFQDLHLNKSGFSSPHPQLFAPSSKCRDKRTEGKDHLKPPRHCLYLRREPQDPKRLSCSLLAGFFQHKASFSSLLELRDHSNESKVLEKPRLVPPELFLNFLKHIQQFGVSWVFWDSLDDKLGKVLLLQSEP